MSSTPNERRMATRHIAYLAAEIELKGEIVGCGLSWDVSTTGFLLVTRRELHIGDELVLRLRVPKEAGPRRLEGFVVRCEPLPAEHRDLWRFEAGISLRSPPADLDVIVQRVSRGCASSRPPSA
jgi:hypothetical protein